MAKNPQEPAGVQVVLKCVYSGGPESPGPGDTIEVDAAEAERLIGLGAATAVPTADPAATAQA